MKHITIYSILLILISILFMPGCENQPTEAEDYDPEPIVQAFLFNGEPVEEVFVERIAPLFEYYDPKDHGITGAVVRIFEVNGNDTLYFVDDPDYPGRYTPAPGDSLVPVGMMLYRIEVTTPAPHNEFIYAETRVPGDIEAHGPVQIFMINDDFSFTQVNDGDTLNRNMPNLNWIWSDVDSVGGFQGMLINLEPRDSLIPLDPDWDPNDPDQEIEDEDRGRFGYDIYRKDQRSVRLYWIAFEWVGWHRVELLAISQSYYDYIFSMFRVQQGVIERADTNINGGLGIFGAVSRHSLKIYMEKVEPIE